jgi:hypothetical protein
MMNLIDSDDFLGRDWTEIAVSLEKSVEGGRERTGIKPNAG